MGVHLCWVPPLPPGLSCWPGFNHHGILAFRFLLPMGKGRWGLTGRGGGGAARHPARGRSSAQW